MNNHKLENQFYSNNSDIKAMTKLMKNRICDKEEEIKNKISEKKNDELSINEYTQHQQILLDELFRRILRDIIPIEFKLFSNKFIKIHELEQDDSLECMVNKIKKNYDM